MYLIAPTSASLNVDVLRYLIGYCQWHHLHVVKMLSQTTEYIYDWIWSSLYVQISQLLTCWAVSKQRVIYKLGIFATSHYCDVTMGAMASQTTSLAIVYLTVYSDAEQRTHQSSASLAFVRGIHRGPVNSPHKWPVTRKMFAFDDVIMGTVCNGDY